MNFTTNLRKKWGNKIFRMQFCLSCIWQSFSKKTLECWMYDFPSSYQIWVENNDLQTLCFAAQILKDTQVMNIGAVSIMIKCFCVQQIHH